MTLNGPPFPEAPRTELAMSFLFSSARRKTRLGRLGCQPARSLAWISGVRKGGELSRRTPAETKYDWDIRDASQPDISIAPRFKSLCSGPRVISNEFRSAVLCEPKVFENLPERIARIGRHASSDDI